MLVYGGWNIMRNKSAIIIMVVQYESVMSEVRVSGG